MDKKNYKIKLHADDLGRSKSINAAIFKSIDSGFVTSVSVMINHKHSLDGIKGAKKRKIKMRLHLNLTEGKSMYKHHQISRLVNSTGTFCNSFFSLFVAPLKPNFKKIKEETKKEIYEQIKFYLKKNKLKKLNLDGHQHIHCIPWISNIVINAKLKFKLKEMRVPNEKFFLSSYKNIFKSWYFTNVIKFSLLKVLSKIITKKIKKNKINYNDFFVGLLDTGHMTLNSIKNGIDNLAHTQKSSLIEVLIHPGYSSTKEKDLWDTKQQHSYYIKKERHNELLLSKNKKLKKILYYENTFNT